MSGFVYLIGSAEFGWYKIGKSETPEVRIKDIGVLLPFKIQVFAIWKAKNHHLLESALHEKYKKHNLNGEWFSFAPDMAKAVIFTDVPDQSRIFPSKSQPFDSLFPKFSNLSRNVVQSSSNLRTIHESQKQVKAQAFHDVGTPARREVREHPGKQEDCSQVRKSIV